MITILLPQSYSTGLLSTASFNSSNSEIVPILKPSQTRSILNTILSNSFEEEISIDDIVDIAAYLDGCARSLSLALSLCCIDSLLLVEQIQGSLLY